MNKFFIMMGSGDEQSITPIVDIVEGREIVMLFDESVDAVAFGYEIFHYTD